MTTLEQRLEGLELSVELANLKLDVLLARAGANRPDALGPLTARLHAATARLTTALASATPNPPTAAGSKPGK